MQEILSTIAAILSEEDDFLVTAHTNPDGDAMGSSCGMAWLLHRLGKRVIIYNESGVPPFLSWLSFPCRVISDLDELEFEPKRFIVLDCGDASRIGEKMHAYLAGKPSIQLDHHLGNPNFAAVNWVDTNCAAVGEMIALLAQFMGMELSGGLGESCYLAMMTDTGHFAFGNTTPRVMELAAEILRQGLDLETFTASYEANWSFERVMLWGKLFNSISLAHNGTVAYVTLPDSLFAETGTKLSDTEGFVNYLRRISGVKVALTVREAGEGQCKISMRSHGKVDVQQVAAGFGGGGHRNAAGATLYKSLDDAVEAALFVIGKKLSLDGDKA